MCTYYIKGVIYNVEIQDILGYLLGVSSRFIKRKMDKELLRYSLTTSQWAVIKLLSKEDGLTQVQIAQKLKGDKATAGSVILNLHEKQYVDKMLGQNDKRAYVISLTKKGRDAVEEINLIAHNVTREALAGISEENQKILKASLEKIISNLSEGE